MTKTTHKRNMYLKLVLSIIFDVIGMATFAIPVIGEVGDLIWAPISAILMAQMYKGQTGKVAGLVSLFEELMPGIDIIPTFTLTWLYRYVLKGKVIFKNPVNVR